MTPSNLGNTPLICTLGGSWAVIPELAGAVWPDLCPFYAQGAPQRAVINETLRLRPDSLWVVTTGGTQAGIEMLYRWWNVIGKPLPLHVFLIEGDDVSVQLDVDLTRELIYRAVLAGTSGSVLSLAGGRKTMSADIQRAGIAFGCQAMFHVVAPAPSSLPEPLKSAHPESFSQALDRSVTDVIHLVIVGSSKPSALLHLEPGITSDRFPLPEDGVFLGPGKEGWLWKALAKREREGSRLMANFHAEIARMEHHENWRQLYRLSPDEIRTLKSQSLQESDRTLLTRLPKVDLHCHVGGMLDIRAQKAVGEAIWAQLSNGQKDTALSVANAISDENNWPERLRKSHVPRPHLAAALLTMSTVDDLQKRLYAPTEPRVALTRTHPFGFSAYEWPGELSGSALLSEPSALAEYARQVVESCRNQGLWHLELRGSPHKYRPKAQHEWLIDWRDALMAAGAQCDCLNAALLPHAPRITWISIIDRRNPEDIPSAVAAAVFARQCMPGFVVGLDLAGDETKTPPLTIAPHFNPAFEACLNITIHAGEGESAESIWQAAYHLHADRIGHGLTLAQQPELAARFRDRRICLELCPTSNREVVGFADPTYPNSLTYPRYPLVTLWRDLGQPLTLCTDNPGISRTDMVNEYLTATRMTENSEGEGGGISRWEALAMLRQAMMHCFLSSIERDTLIKSADMYIHRLLTEENGSWLSS